MFAPVVFICQTVRRVWTKLNQFWRHIGHSQMHKATVSHLTYLISFRNESCGSASEGQKPRLVCIMTCSQTSWCWPEVDFQNSGRHYCFSHFFRVGRLWDVLFETMNYMTVFIEEFNHCGQLSGQLGCTSHRRRCPKYRKDSYMWVWSDWHSAEGRYVVVLGSMCFCLYVAACK